MTHEDDIGCGRLVGLEPGAKVISCDIHSLVGLVPGIYLGVDNVRMGQGPLQEVVHMGRKRMEGGIVAHVAVDVYHQ